MGVSLTPGAILKIVTGKCTENDLYKPVLKVTHIDGLPTRSKDGKKWYLTGLSDGSFEEYVGIADEILISKKLQKGSIVQLTKFQLTKIITSNSKGEIISESVILVWDYNLLHSQRDIIGDPKLYHHNETPLVVRSTPTVPDKDQIHANSHHVEQPPTSKQKQDHVDSLLNENIDDSRHVEEPPTSIPYPSTTTQKCSSLFPTQNKKRKFLSSNDAISVFGKNISETGINLTSGAITKIVTSNCTENDLKPVLQLIDFYSGSRRSKDDNQWYLLVLSDGSFWQFGRIADEIFISKNLQIGSIVQLTKFQLTKSCTTGEIRYIFVCDLNVICSKCDIIGDPTLIPHNETPKMEIYVLPISDHDRADPDLNEDDVDDSHRGEEPPPPLEQNLLDSTQRVFLINDLNVIHSKCDIIVNQEPFPRNDTPLVERSTPPIPDEDHVDVSHAQESATSTEKCSVLDRYKPTIMDHDHSESDTNEDVDNSHPAEEPSATTQKCSFHSLNQSKKRKRRSSNDNISKVVEDVSKMTKLTMEKIKTVEVGFKRLETLEEDVSKMAKMMKKNKKNDVGACFKKLETLEEDVSKMTRMMMEANKEVDVGYKKLETLEEDVSRMTIMMMEKNKEDVVGFKKLETLTEDVSKMKKMMEKNKEDDVGACFKKLETLEENVSKLTRMMMEKNKEDDMGACIEKLDKIGWVAQDPMYDTALLLFGQSADYRKLWLHLKPESCGNWVTNAGSMFGLLD